jgi:hypothetical protein
MINSQAKAQIMNRTFRKSFAKASEVPMDEQDLFAQSLEAVSSRLKKSR